MSVAPDLSVVVPLYDEQENLPVLYDRLTRSLTALGLDYEVVFVNDGSRDATPELLDGMAAHDARVVAVHLSRNFGHQAAISAGLDTAAGGAVVLMDGDLQDPPEVLGRFVAAWRAGGDVVYAVRTRRKEGLLKRLAYAGFYRLLRATSDLDIPLDSGDFCLMDRKVVEALRALPERQRFVRGLRTFVGFRQTGLAYERDARHAGTPKYTLRSLFRLAADGLVSFSASPLSVVSYLGAGSFVLAVLVTCWVVGDAWANGTAPRGWASALAVTLYLSATQLLCLGMMAEYLRRIFLEVKGRPTYVVARVSGQVVRRAAARVTCSGVECGGGFASAAFASGLSRSPRKREKQER
jgi:dolichol-phosphate mannosyltransferase